MMSLLKASVGGLTGMWRVSGHQQGLLPSHLKVISAGLKSLSEIPPDFSDVVMPEKVKLKFLNKVPTLNKAVKDPKKLRDIRGPQPGETTFKSGQYGILAMGGGYIHWGHIEMIRLTINRKMDPRTTFAQWGISAPYKPITRKGLGQRMGGGKGAVDHYVTPVRSGRLIVEVGGKVELGEVEHILTEVARKLPFPAKVVSRESLEAMKKKQIEMEQNNQNPWTFKQIARANMLGIRKALSPFDLRYHGRHTGKFLLPGRV